ncbi:MAG: hypothetical protein ACRDNK_11440 [Solirubrobacteraceae bacterium]
MKIDSIEQLVRSIDPLGQVNPKDLSRSGNYEALLADILAAERQPTRRPRWPVVLPMLAIVAAAAALVIFGPAGPLRGPSSAQASSLSFSTSGGYIVARVKDLYTSPARYRAAFAEHGLHISLLVVPSDPSMVGSVGLGSADYREITASGHPLELRIPNRFTGSAQIVLGRAARPGERYQQFPSSDFDRGQPLYCTGLYGATVNRVMAVIRARGYAVVTAQGVGSAIPGPPPAGDYVWGAAPYAPGVIALTARPKRAPALSKPDAAATNCSSGLSHR